MIVPNQSNIKVHFAGLENQDFAEVLMKISGVRYSLFTVFPFIAHHLGVKPMKMKTCTNESAKFLGEFSKHSIMDSGLFTLMFGAHAGNRTQHEIQIWYHALTNFVLENKVKSTCVEIDCQKILGTEAAWKYREKIKHELPNNRIINVFHKEDGQKGLDRLIEFSDYIAISVPELRALKQKKFTNSIAHYIKNKKPSIDIHLLGCTENKLLKELNFCSSADSTSWQQVNRYGHLSFNHGVKTVKVKNSAIKIEALNSRYESELREILSKWMDITPKRLDYYSKYALAGELLYRQYTTHAGPQD